MRLSNRQFNLLAITALVAVAAHLSRLPFWLSAALVMVAPLRMFVRARSARIVSAWIRVPLVFLLVVIVVLHYGNLFGREPGSALACGLLMLKLLESERVRDARAATGFAAFVLMSALLFTQTLLFTLLVSSCLVLLLATLNALEPAPLDRGHPLRGELRTAFVLLLFGLPLATAAFLFVPRLGSPLWGAPGGGTDSLTGLDDRMEPGSLTELLIDDSPALRVEFDGPIPGPPARYFRALVMWDFDGTTWSVGAGRAHAPVEPVMTEVAPIDYEIVLEPARGPWLVALDVPLASDDDLRMSPDRTLSARAKSDVPRQYRVRSALDYRLAPAIDAEDRRRALRLPEGFNPRTLALARRWRSEGHPDTAIVQLALALFNARFTYTLAAPLLGRDSVDDFLFDTRAGYCEHFSSSFVVLMRAAGIPARVVTGYQGGWWNAFGNYLLVRQSDAHAWSEVWLAGRGWVRVDPTAAVNPARIESGATAADRAQTWYSGAWWLDLRNRLDVINRVWTASVVQFNALRQKSLLTPLGIQKADQRDLLLALAATFAVILLAASIWVMRAGSRRKGDALDEAWRRLCRFISPPGDSIRPDEGPLDYLARNRAAFGDPLIRSRLDSLVDAYVRLRYAVEKPVPAEVQAFARRVGEFRALRGVRDSG